MLIYLHVALLLIPFLAVPVVAYLGQKGGTIRDGDLVIVLKWRSGLEFGIAMWPFLLIGILSVFTDPRGAPGSEWILPTIAAILSFLLCRSMRVFRRAWLGLFGLTLVLITNLNLLLAHGGYARRSVAADFTWDRESLTKAMAQQNIEKQFGSEVVLPESPVALLLKEESYDRVESNDLEDEWHTRFTRLCAMRRKERALWC